MRKHVAGDGRRAVRRAEPSEEAADVLLHRPGSHTHEVRDLLVRRAAGDESEDLLLARRDPARRRCTAARNVQRETEDLAAVRELAAENAEERGTQRLDLDPHVEVAVGAVLERRERLGPIGFLGHDDRSRERREAHDTCPVECGRRIGDREVVDVRWSDRRVRPRRRDGRIGEGGTQARDERIGRADHVHPEAALPFLLRHRPTNGQIPLRVNRTCAESHADSPVAATAYLTLSTSLTASTTRRRALSSHVGSERSGGRVPSDAELEIEFASLIELLRTTLSSASPRRMRNSGVSSVRPYAYRHAHPRPTYRQVGRCLSRARRHALLCPTRGALPSN